MLTIYDLIERIHSNSQEVEQIVCLLEKYHEEGNYDCLVSTIKRGLRVTSDMFLRQREILLSLHELLPSFSWSKGILDSKYETMNVFVEQLMDFDFPVYKVSLPLLLPNMRRRREDFNNAITQSVMDAVRCFCVKNNVRPFEVATVFYLSFGETIDNDNKEASVIQNGLIGYLLNDDSPATCQSIYYHGNSEENRHTEIYVVDSAHDIEVLQFIKDFISGTKN